VIVDLLRGEDAQLGDDIKPMINKSINDIKFAWGNVPISNETYKFLRSIWLESQGDVTAFRKLLEKWFDDTMERCTGWYKKNTQYLLLVIGLVIAIIFNVDTISIAGKLEKDPKLRDAVVQQSDAFVKAHPNLYQERISELNTNNKTYQAAVAVIKKDSTAKTDTVNATLTLVKSDSIARAESDSLLNRGKLLAHQADSLVKGDIAKVNGVMGMGLNSFTFKDRDLGDFLLSLLGWIITALALSLGAPFWFDLLNKLMKLRGSVSTSTTTEGKKTGQKNE